MTDQPTIFVTGATDGLGRALAHRLASDVRQATDRLDVFVSNAGIGSGPPDGRTRRTSADGHELRFAVNYLAGVPPHPPPAPPAAQIRVGQDGPAGGRPHIDSIEDGTAATRRLISDGALATTTGRFFDRTREARADAQAYDTRARAELRQRSLVLVGHDDLT